MAQGNQNQQRKGGGNRGGGGPQARIYIANVKVQPTDPSDPKKNDQFDITVSLAHTRPGDSHIRFAARIYIQDKIVRSTTVGDTVKDEPIKGVKLDLDKEVIVRVEKAGFSGEGDTFEIDRSGLKKKSAASTSTRKGTRFEAKVGNIRPDKSNPVHLITRDADGNGIRGTVAIDCGQEFDVRDTHGATHILPGASYNHETDDTGSSTVFITVDTTAPATFTHIESGESRERWLQGKAS